MSSLRRTFPILAALVATALPLSPPANAQTAPAPNQTGIAPTQAEPPAPPQPGTPPQEGAVTGEESGPAAYGPPAPPPPLSAEAAMKAAHDRYAKPPPKPEFPAECERTPHGEGEIVVCAPLENQDRFRIPSSSDDGDNSKLGWAGDPPDVSGPGIFKGPATVGGLCGIGLNPCPPPPVYYFDITALPEPPPGSDADKVAKGEIPPG